MDRSSASTTRIADDNGDEVVPLIRNPLLFSYRSPYSQFLKFVDSLEVFEDEMVKVLKM